MEKYILSLDLGTTAIKVALIDLDGRMKSSATMDYTLLTPDVLSVELPVEVYWENFKGGVRKILESTGIQPDSIACMGISAQGETIILLDKTGEPLMNAIVWMDNRAQDEAEELKQIIQDDIFYSHTGQVSMVPTWPAAKLRWIKKNLPETFDAIDKVLLIEDYFIWRLTGKFVCEGSLICSTGYWDINTKQWWPEMLECLGITEDKLPVIKNSGDPVGGILADVAKELGLSEQTVVCMGVLDQAAGAVGVGNIYPGCFSECTGAALAICATTDSSFEDEEKQMPCHYHAIKDTYMAHTFTSGGMVLKWFKNQFCKNDEIVADAMDESVFYVIDKEAENIPAGSEGLVMLPHLQGAMAPEANPKAKGVFYGITLKHTKAHFARAIMESVGFIIKRNLKTLERMGFTFNEIRVLGGGSVSPLWNQIKADITGMTICQTSIQNAACLGAAIVAGSGCGLFDSLEDAVKNMVVVTARYEPDPERSEIYEKAFEKYVNLYEALCPVFDMDRKDWCKS